MRIALALLLGASTIATASEDYISGRAFDRFFTIWLENRDYLDTSKNAHILDLAKQGILLTQYYGLTHPSQPNYLASVAGDYFGLNHDDFVRIPENVSTIVDLFDTQEIAWKGYFEGLPGPGYMGLASTDVDGTWDYVRKHNPFVSFDSVNLNGSRLMNLQSLDAFQRDVAANDLPQYGFITPDMLNDGHNTSLEYSTEWAHSFLKPLLANKDFMEKTLILLTFDESETYSIPNRIVSVLLGGAVPSDKVGTTDDTVYTHYSILSTLENNWNLPNLGRYDVGANVFQCVADQTGYQNQIPPNVNSINNSLSYKGSLNNGADMYEPIPAPNLKLVGAGGKGVVDVVKSDWADEADVDSPYDGSGAVYDGGDGTSNPNAPVYKAQAKNNLTLMEGSKSKSLGARTMPSWWMSLMFGLGVVGLAGI